jgi:hypothetical protein
MLLFFNLQFGIGAFICASIILYCLLNLTLEFLLKQLGRDVGLADNIVGSASIPISCVREGYRSVNLFDSNNKRNGPYECASLLVDLEMEEISQQIPMW